MNEIQTSFNDVTNAITSLSRALHDGKNSDIHELHVQAIYALADLASAKNRQGRIVREFNDSVATEPDESIG